MWHRRTLTNAGSKDLNMDGGAEFERPMCSEYCAAFREINDRQNAWLGHNGYGRLRGLSAVRTHVREPRWPVR